MVGAAVLPRIRYARGARHRDAVFQPVRSSNPNAAVARDPVRTHGDRSESKSVAWGSVAPGSSKGWFLPCRALEDGGRAASSGVAQPWSMGWATTVLGCLYLPRNRGVGSRVVPHRGSKAAVGSDAGIGGRLPGATCPNSVVGDTTTCGLQFYGYTELMRTRITRISSWAGALCLAVALGAVGCAPRVASPPPKAPAQAKAQKGKQKTRNPARQHVAPPPAYGNKVVMASSEAPATSM